MQRNNGPGFPREFQQYFDNRKGGLPRTSFADDPFFDQGFPHRRFGSNPRLSNDFFGEEPSFHQQYFQQPSFSQSLPRRSPTNRQQSHSESQPGNVTIIKTNIPERDQNQAQPQPQPEKQQANSQANLPPQPPQSQSIPIQHLRTERTPVAKSPSADSQSTSSSSGIAANGSVATESNVPSSRRTSIAESEPKPTTMPIVNGQQSETPSRAVPIGLVRKGSVDDFNEQIVNLLDEAEKRVEMLREQAGVLEQEKEQLLDILKNVELNADLLRLGQGDREDINATTNRLLNRCKTVEVVVNTPRNGEQMKALNAVNSLIEGAVTKMQEDLLNSKEMMQRFLNACNPDMPEGPIDQRFQAQVIECTADDQKKIRRKLASIIQQIDRAQRTCEPYF